MAYNPDMPDELQDGYAVMADQTDAPTPEEVFEDICKAITTLRTEAVDGRRASGLERIWTACEEAYAGIDDANRDQFSGGWEKPTSKEGPLTKGRAGGDATRATVFVPLTRRYVDIGSAKICEFTDPIDERPFSIKPTPVPTLTGAADSKVPLKDGSGKQVFRQVVQGETQQPQHSINGEPAVPATVGDHATALMQQATACATKAEDQIYDWMVEANYAAQKRIFIFDAARLGCGLLKAPFPTYSTSVKRVGNKLQRDSKMVPGMKRVSPWKFYPDPACGENIHDGEYCFEEDNITAAKLKKLKLEKLPSGKAIYIGSAIDKVLDEGPKTSTVGQDAKKDSGKKKIPFKIWYFTGLLSRKDMVTLQAAGMDELPAELTDINATVTMVNDTIIRATPNPLDSGKFPYLVMKWSRREGTWDGRGISEQVDMPQRGVNAGTRALFNNAGLSAGVQVVIDSNQVEPRDGVWSLTPNKLWRFTANATTDDARKVFQAVTFPNLGPQLQALIEYNFKLAEESTNIPMVTQGRDGQNAPETFGQAELQNNNSHTLLRDIAKGLSDDIEAPLVNELYEWLLLDESVPDDAKGDFKINAQGSVVMMEKAIQELVLAQLLALSKDPAYGLNPAKLMAQYLKAKRLQPDLISYTDEEKKKMASQPQPEDPTITAAKIRAASAEKVAGGHDQATVAKSKADTDRDTIYANAERERAASAAHSASEKLQAEIQLETLKYANQQKISLEEVKAKLADTAMRLNVQKELSAAALAIDLHKHNNPPPVITPPTEPAGRARNGQAFAQ